MSYNLRHSFGPGDVTAVAILPDDIQILEEITNMAISTHVDKEPIRRLGRTLPNGWAAGSGTIAGTLIAAQLTHGALWKVRRHMSTIRYAGGVALASTEAAGVQEPGYLTEEVLQGARDGELDVRRITAEVDNYAASMLVQQLPPFHLMFVHQSEAGQMGLARLYGVTFTDHSVTKGADNTPEESLQFKALFYEQLRLRKSLSTTEMQNLYEKAMNNAGNLEPGDRHKGVGFFNDIRRPQLVDELDEALGAKSLGDYLLMETRESVRRTQAGEQTNFNVMDTGAVIVQPFQVGGDEEEAVPLDPEGGYDAWRYQTPIDEPTYLGEPETYEEPEDDPYRRLSDWHRIIISNLHGWHLKGDGVEIELRVRFVDTDTAVAIKEAEYTITVAGEEVSSGAAEQVRSARVREKSWEAYYPVLLAEAASLLQQWWRGPQLHTEGMLSNKIQARVELPDVQGGGNSSFIPEGEYEEQNGEGVIRIEPKSGVGPDREYEFDFSDVHKPWTFSREPNSFSAAELLGQKQRVPLIDVLNNKTTVRLHAADRTNVRFEHNEPERFIVRGTPLIPGNTEEQLLTVSDTNNIDAAKEADAEPGTTDPLSYFIDDSTNESVYLAEGTVVGMPGTVFAYITTSGFLGLQYTVSGTTVSRIKPDRIAPDFREDFRVHTGSRGPENRAPHLATGSNNVFQRLVTRSEVFVFESLSVEIEVQYRLDIALYDIGIEGVIVRPQDRRQRNRVFVRTGDIDPSYYWNDQRGWYTESADLPTPFYVNWIDRDLVLNPEFVLTTADGGYLGHMGSDGLFDLDVDTEVDSEFWTAAQAN